MFFEILVHAVFLTQVFSSDYRSFVTEAYRDLCPFSRTCAQPPKFQFPSNRKGQSPCCRPCSCKKDCWMSESCCPDAEYAAKTLPETNVSLNMECLTAAYPIKVSQNDGKTMILTRYLTVNSCPKGYQNETVVNLCRSSNPKTLLEVSIVSDADNNMYRNVYCAVCNGVSAFRRWVMDITCSSLDRLYNKLTVESMNDSGCVVWSNSLNLQVPDERLCYVPKYSKCNMTGKWQVYNSSIEKACESGQFGVYWKLFSSLYANVFCFLCNEDMATTYTGTDICPSVSLFQKMLREPFTAVLNMQGLGTSSGQQSRKCGVIEIYDRYAGVCRELKCPILSYPSYGTCRESFYFTENFPVAFCFRLNSVIPTPPSDKDYASSMLVEITDELVGLIEKRQKGECRICSVSTRTEPLMKNLTFSTCAVLSTFRSCSLSEILSIANSFQDNSVFTSVTVFNTKLLPESLQSFIKDRKYYVKLPNVCGRSRSMYFNRNECPRVNISGRDYLSAIRRNYISPTKHYYAHILAQPNETILSNVYFDICVDEYFRSSTSHLMNHSNFGMPLFIFAFIIDRSFTLILH